MHHLSDMGRAELREREDKRSAIYDAFALRQRIKAAVDRFKGEMQQVAADAKRGAKDCFDADAFLDAVDAYSEDLAADDGDLVVEILKADDRLREAEHRRDYGDESDAQDHGTYRTSNGMRAA